MGKLISSGTGVYQVTCSRNYNFIVFGAIDCLFYNNLHRLSENMGRETENVIKIYSTSSRDCLNVVFVI